LTVLKVVGLAESKAGCSAVHWAGHLVNLLVVHSELPRAGCWVVLMDKSKAEYWAECLGP